MINSEVWASYGAPTLILVIAWIGVVAMWFYRRHVDRLNARDEQ